VCVCDFLHVFLEIHCFFFFFSFFSFFSFAGSFVYLCSVPKACEDHSVVTSNVWLFVGCLHFGKEKKKLLVLVLVLCVVMVATRERRDVISVRYRGRECGVSF
jgi:hypothetical protein